MKEEKKEETIDRRIRKTRRLLRECLTALLKEKKVQDITVGKLPIWQTSIVEPFTCIIKMSLT